MQKTPHPTRWHNQTKLAIRAKTTPRLRGNAVSKCSQATIAHKATLKPSTKLRKPNWNGKE